MRFKKSRTWGSTLVQAAAPFDPEYEILQKLGTDSGYREYRHDQLWNVDGKALFDSDTGTDVKIYFYSVRINFN